MKDSNQKVIFLIRHGNTEFNEKKIFRGHFDIPLDETGIEQAQKTGNFLKNVKIDVIYSSPLSRAYKTAETIKNFQKDNNNNNYDDDNNNDDNSNDNDNSNNNNNNIKFNDIKLLKEEGFIDLNFGEWEGKSYNEVSLNYPEIYNQWIKEPFKVSIPKGETLYEAQDRAWKTLKKIITEGSETFIVVVTHRIICKLLIIKMLDISESGIWKINQMPCCINIFEYKYQTFFASVLNYGFHIFDLQESFFRID